MDCGVLLRQAFTELNVSRTTVGGVAILQCQRGYRFVTNETLIVVECILAYDNSTCGWNRTTFPECQSKFHF